MERIKYLREKAGLTQKELGLKVGQTSSNISKYELGILEPNIRTLNAIADYFDVSVDFLTEASNITNRVGKEESSYIYIFGDSGIGERIMVPQDKIERLKALIDAGIPELFDK